MSFTKQNIKAIKYMHIYLEKIYISFKSLHKTFVDFQDELYEILNILNFRQITEQFIDSYNRIITFLFDRIKGILDMTFIGENSKEIQIIKPTRNNKYIHELEITCITDDNILHKPIGNITTVNINKINDEICLLRGEHMFTFILFDLQACISNEDFRNHIKNNLDTIKNILEWFYSDVESVKVSFKVLINIITELIHLSEKKYTGEWINILEKIKETINNIKNEQNII